MTTDPVSRAEYTVDTLRGLARNDESANLLPHEQTAVTLGALAIEMLDVDQTGQLMAGEDELFEGYSKPEAGD